MEVNKITVKAEFEGDIRRIALNANNFLSLQKLISELFGLQQGTFSIKYKDDEGDLITLCTDEEFAEGLRCAKDNILRLNIVKAQQQGGRCGWRRRWQQQQQQSQDGGKGKEEQGSEQQQNPLGGRCGGWRKWHHGRHHGQHHGHNPANLFQSMGPIIQQLAGGLIGSGKVDSLLEDILKSDFCRLEHNYECDGCNTPISGTRYHCANCEDFDFCVQCYESKRKDHNETHQFEEVTALNALKEALKSNNITIDTFISPGKATDAPAKVVHPAICDRCDKRVEGIRWKCFECDDFDLCNNCFLEANGKEDIRSHKKEHGFGKMTDPSQIPAFHEERLRLRESRERENILQKVEEKEREEEERIAELERRKKEIDEKIEVERKRFAEIEAQLEKERLALLEQPLEKPKAPLDILAPMREQISQQEKVVEVKPVEPVQKPVEVVEEPKIVYPFEEKLEALKSMGFHDRERNIKLLIQNRGELLPVIQSLLGDN